MSPDDLLIVRSEGLFIAGFDDGTAVFDPLTETTHVLGPLASWLLSIEIPTTFGDLVQEACAGAGVQVEQLEPQIMAAVDELTGLGLLGRSERVAAPGPWPGSSLGWTHPRGSVHDVIDLGLSFRGADQELLAEIDDFFGGGDPDGSPDVIIDIERTVDGGVTVHAADQWDFPDVAAMYRQLPDVINEYAAQVDSNVVLHAGAVRTPDGRILVMPGPMNAGKSTLVAALVQVGCDYLGDESIGVQFDHLTVLGYPKPISVDPQTRTLLGADGIAEPHIKPRDLRANVELLGGEVGPIDQVVLVQYDPSPPGWYEQLSSHGALRALLGNTLNLIRAGQRGLDTLCRIAEEVPVVRIVHDNSLRLATELLVRRPPAPTGSRFLRSHPVDRLVPEVCADVEAVELGTSNGTLTILRRIDDAKCVVVDPVGTDVLHRIDGGATIEQIVSSVDIDGEIDQVWRTVVDRLHALSSIGSLIKVSAPGKDLDDAVSDWTRVGEEPLSGFGSAGIQLIIDPRADDGTKGSDPDGDVRQLGGSLDLGDWIFITNHADLAASVGDVIDSVESPQLRGTGAMADGRSQTVGVQVLPGDDTGSLLRLGDRPPVWIAPGYERNCVLSLVMATRERKVSGECEGALLAPTWALISEGRAVLYTGSPPVDQRVVARDGHESGWVLLCGATLKDGRVLVVPDVHQIPDRRVIAADPVPIETMTGTFELVGLGITGDISSADTWGRAIRSLLLEVDTPCPILADLIGDGSRIVFDTDDDVLVSRLRRLVGLDEPPASPTELVEPLIGAPLDRAAGADDVRDFLTWASRLGDLSVAYESSRIDDQRIVMGRPLLRVELPVIATGVLVPGTRRQLRQGLEYYGLTDADIDEIVGAIDAGAWFYVSEETSEAGSRRKFYLTGVSEEAWKAIGYHWSSWLPTDMQQPPTWLAWKVSHDGEVSRAAEIPWLGSSPTVGASVDMVLSTMPEQWRDCLRDMMSRFGIDMGSSPFGPDLLTYQDDGRISVDLAVDLRRMDDRRIDIEAELRWLVSLAGHDTTRAHRLVDWVSRRRVQRLIFGSGTSDRPLVNLYTSSIDES